MIQTRKKWLTRIGAVGALSVGALGLVGCSNDTSGSEEGVDVEDVQEGAEEADEVRSYVYDQSFYDDLETLDGQEVTVSANVNEIIADDGFTIAGTDETTVDELLVLHQGEMPPIEPGEPVSVTGTVHYVFDLPQAEEAYEVDLDDELFADWDSLPYIAAESIDTSVPETEGTQ